MKRPIYIPHKHAGLSLIEMMIALVIGLILSVGIVQIFIATRTAYKLSEGIARNQESSRFALEYIEEDLRMAGYFGCVNDQSELRIANAVRNSITNSSGSEATNFTTSIQGYEANGTGPGTTVTIGAMPGNWTPNLPSDITALNPLPGSDILVLRFLAAPSARVTQIQASDSGSTFSIPSDLLTNLTFDGVNSPVLYGISDCNYVDFFRANAFSPDTAQIVTSTAITRYGMKPAEQTRLSRAESFVYFVGMNQQQRPSLYRARYNGTNYIKEELVEGIESLQFIYGQDSQTDIINNRPTGYINYYDTAANISGQSQWLRVGSVQVGLLVQSPETVSDDVARNTKVLGVNYQPPVTNDQRLRSSYEVTVALRNRLYGN